MRNQALAVALGLMTVLGVACGGTEAAPEPATPASEGSDGTVMELGNGCPHNPFSCFKHCQGKGKKGKCGGTQDSVCTCSDK